jgi:hypothetical protein
VTMELRVRPHAPPPQVGANMGTLATTDLSLLYNDHKTQK